MISVAIEQSFDSWRSRAREFLQKGISPSEILWSSREACQDELFRMGEASEKRDRSHVRIPKAFFELAETVACHREEERWALLYSLAWRISRGGERHLLSLEADREIRRAHVMAKDVRRDCHKMRAFVRFRKVGESATGREQFVSWFEPFHHIVERNAGFFRGRFTGMDWSILTPERCVHWDGKELHFTEGVSKSHAPDDDELEDLWRTYYRNIFNPARLKLNAMRAEMPVKYWKNLPEAPLIQELTNSASYRVNQMVDRTALTPKDRPKSSYLDGLHESNESLTLSQAPGSIAPYTLDEWREMASCCRACPLWESATQTVFGEGNPNAEIMIIGEQPGDQEDLAGRPFVGPAGKLLNDALSAAEIGRGELYITNAVKHFKWKPSKGSVSGRGPKRLHDKANRNEMKACRPWLLGEIAKIQPSTIITLGNTAAQSVIRQDFRILSERGVVKGPNDIGFGGKIIATVHPSYLLRIRDRKEKEAEMRRFIDELRLAGDSPH